LGRDYGGLKVNQAKRLKDLERENERLWKVVQLAQGQILFRQGDAADALYLVVEGAIIPIAEGAEGEGRRKLAVIERGDFVGEIGVMTKQPRNATVAALVETKLVAIDRRVLVPLMQQEPSVAQGILRFLRARMLDRQIRSNLFFAAFAHAEREAVARQFRLLEVKDGTRVVVQGAPPEGLFVVLAGSLAKIDRTRRKQLGRLELGDVFGGDWLIAGKASPWDVVAQGRAWLIVLGERRFRHIVDANPRLVRVLERLARRTPRPAPNPVRRRPISASRPTPAPPPSSPPPARPSSPPPSPRAAAADRARRSRS
jgi:CRP-like cAMP-binding protein